MRVTLYSMPGRGPCDQVRITLDRLASRYGLVVEEVDILRDGALHQALHARVPVVELEDGKLGRLEAPIDEAQLRVHLEIAHRAIPSGRSALQAGRGRVASPSGTPGTYIQRRWLRLACSGFGAFVGLAWLAPVFAALGLWNVADAIYSAYALACHQLPERAGSLFGYQAAFCWRNTALYGGLLFFGVLYGLARDRNVPWLWWLKKPIRWRTSVLLLLPMAFDGFSHMLGLRDSLTVNPSFESFYVGSQVFSLNWWLRIFTGSLAALGAVWVAYPRIERAIAQEGSAPAFYWQSAMDVSRRA